MSEKVHGFICSPRMYVFGGWEFEISAYGGPWPLKKDGELRECAGRTFWKMISEFEKLTAEEKKAHRIGGGCVEFSV
jgi:hypothetical protein